MAFSYHSDMMGHNQPLDPVIILKQAQSYGLDISALEVEGEMGLDGKLHARGGRCEDSFLLRGTTMRVKPADPSTLICAAECLRNIKIFMDSGSRLIQTPLFFFQEIASLNRRFEASRPEIEGSAVEAFKVFFYSKDNLKLKAAPSYLDALGEWPEIVDKAWSEAKAHWPEALAADNYSLFKEAGADYWPSSSKPKHSWAVWHLPFLAQISVPRGAAALTESLRLNYLSTVKNDLFHIPTQLAVSLPPGLGRVTFTPKLQADEWEILQTLLADNEEERLDVLVAYARSV